MRTQRDNQDLFIVYCQTGKHPQLVPMKIRHQMKVMLPRDSKQRNITGYLRIWNQSNP